MEHLSFDAEREKVGELKGKLSFLAKLLETQKADLRKAEQDLADSEEAQDMLQKLAQAVQQQVHGRISKVVSTCLESVFPDPYEFHIEFERKRGKTEASLKFIRDGNQLDPLTSAGGGMVDVAAFALRMSALMLHRPRISRVLVADEPFRFVSVQYQDSIREMLEKLSKDTGIQIIFVTHNETYETGKVVRIP